MDREWNQFLGPMTVFLIVLSVAAAFAYYMHGAEFWNTFYPQFLATAIGVVLTIILAWVFWRHRQRAEESRTRQQLLKDLTFEVSENLKWLENLKNFLGEPSSPEYTSLSRGLKTITMKYALNPEKFLLFRDFDLADKIDGTVRICEEFNNNYHHQFGKFIIDDLVASTSKDRRQRVREAFSVEILPDIDYHHRILEELKNKLVKLTTHNSDKL